MQYGFGKLILFGEHFVVYGLPGIASAIDLYTSCRLLENANGIKVRDRLTNKNIVLGENTQEILDKTMQEILSEMKLEGKNFRLEIDGNIPVFGGLGSSAALIVSIIRELNKHFELKLSNERLNEIAFKAEHVFHGNPSGIDNTVSVYGGMIWFEKNMAGGKNKIESIKANIKQLHVVIGNTKIIRDTGDVVTEVRQRKEKEPARFEKIFAQAKSLVIEARKELEKGNEKRLGQMMNENHKLLQEIEVSSPELDKLCEIALKNGALGAKLTGAGKGGCMFALCSDKKNQNKIKKEFEKKGFEGYITMVSG